MITVRRILSIVLVLLFIWISFKSYNYFFDRSLPELSINGLEPGACYSGDINCLVRVSKPSEVSVWLDKKPVISRFKLNRANLENSLPIPTKAISNGSHALRLEACDGSYNKNKAVYECEFNIDNTPLQAAIIKSGTDNKVFQGRTLHLQFQANKELDNAHVKALSGTYPCIPEGKNSTIYEAFIPVPCEEGPNEYPIRIEVKDRVGNNVVLDDKFQVMAYPFKKAVVHVSSEKMRGEHEAGIQTQQLEGALEECTRNSPPHKMWRGNFFIPLEMTRITGDYGTVRTTQEKGRYAHKALDLIGPVKCVVWAPHDGVVVIKERYVHTGNTVVLDHGLGVLSLLCHLDSFADISVGDKVRRGNPIGIMGSTGFAGGAHLHWEHRVNNIPVDPMQWTKTDF